MFTLLSTLLNKEVSAFVILCLVPQVFATYPNEDYDRRNEDVDPMAASAEYELEKRVERLDLFPVELEKGTEHEKSPKKPAVFSQCSHAQYVCLCTAAFRRLGCGHAKNSEF